MVLQRVLSPGDVTFDTGGGGGGGGSGTVVVLGITVAWYTGLLSSSSTYPGLAKFRGEPAIIPTWKIFMILILSANSQIITHFSGQFPTLTQQINTFSSLETKALIVCTEFWAECVQS